MSYWNQMSFPDPGTEMAARLSSYHDMVLVVVVMVLVLVGWFLTVFFMAGKLFSGSFNRYVYKNEWLETFWTVTPAAFLGVLGYVSLVNLYDMEVGDHVDHVVKVTGHQWYWEYRYEVSFSEVNKEQHKQYLVDWLETNSGLSLTGSDWRSSLEGLAELFMVGDWFLKHDSYLVPEGDQVSGNFGMKSGFRNQDVSMVCYLAHSSKNEILVSTADVMHSWGVSELGVKVDAVPGRGNAVSVEPVMPGFAFGNCYELCGEGHSQMPVVAFISSFDNMVWSLKNEIMVADTTKEFFDSL